uniref:Uncharacterized protein n=1 Tax=Arundo donax TaxID=35708 RepID=A0A0A9DYA2_ARUDO
MIGARGAQAFWAAFLMIAFVMTGARAAWSAPHASVPATMITETAVHTFHLDIELASPTTGTTHQVVLIIPHVEGHSMRISGTAAHFAMMDHCLNIVGLLTVMKQARRAEVLSLIPTTKKSHNRKVNQQSNLQRPRLVTM